MGTHRDTRRGRRKTWLASGCVALLLLVVWRIATPYWDEKEKELRSSVRASLEETFSEEFALLGKEYGLHLFPAADTEAQEGKGEVILVHGLDEPGVIWQELAPALAGQHYRVWIMRYPNDQPIHDSARFLAEELQKFTSQTEVERVAVVCHSMGGLVTRDMLTAPDIDYTALRKGRLAPSFSHLIMVGTPNHGSYFAKFRFVTEIRDQLVQAADGEYDWLQPFVDGAGEAALDLVPDSVFLQELNARPLPDVPHQLVIAGVLTAVAREKVARSVRKLAAKLPETAGEFLGTLSPVMDNLAQEIGDGLVSVQSATLEGVPLMEVTGCHLTIIRNLGSDSKRVPPAVPIIIETLALP